jgi:hypothetical protein
MIWIRSASRSYPRLLREPQTRNIAMPASLGQDANRPRKLFADLQRLQFLQNRSSPLEATFEPSIFLGASSFRQSGVYISARSFPNTHRGGALVDQDDRQQQNLDIAIADILEFSSWSSRK